MPTRTKGRRAPGALSSVGNALRILEHLSEAGDAGVSEIARALNLTPGTVHRLLATLVSFGFAAQNPRDRRYRVGDKVAQIAHEMSGRVDFAAVAHQTLVRLKASTGETVNIGVLRGDHVVYIDRVVTDQPLAVAVRIGSAVPAFCTSLGRAILAFAPAETREGYLDRLREIAEVDRRRPPSRRAFAALLHDTARRGYAEDDGDFAPDIACFAAPALDSMGHAVAAISVSGPRTRIRERRDELAPMVRAAGEELSALLRRVGDAADL